MKTGKRKEKLDKILLYLRYLKYSLKLIEEVNAMILNLKRLFLGMGIIWYFELLAFALNTKGTSQRWTYFADCLNMLQVKPFHLLNEPVQPF